LFMLSSSTYNPSRRPFSSTTASVTRADGTPAEAEHSRVYYFQNNANEEIYLGSADLMPRNLDHRVEVVFPVENKGHVRFLRDKILDAYLRDNTRARILESDGKYSRLKPGNEDKLYDVQSHLMGE